ncbi:MAG: hypothetical protein J0I50_05305, partial [Microbacterium sp.]|nr:hypothetical protein [Microbacterium sp.]
MESGVTAGSTAGAGNGGIGGTTTPSIAAGAPVTSAGSGGGGPGATGLFAEGAERGLRGRGDAEGGFGATGFRGALDDFVVDVAEAT